MRGFEGIDVESMLGLDDYDTEEVMVESIPTELTDSLPRESIFIELTDEQFDKAMEMGHNRHYRKHESFRETNTAIFKKNRKNQKILSHEIGALGEVAYSVYTGKELDENLYDLGDTGIDCFENGSEIKTTTFRGNGAELKITKEEWDSKPPYPKKYVLTRVNLDNLQRVELIGEITREKFDSIKVEKTYIKGERNAPVNYICTMRDLKTVSK